MTSRASSLSAVSACHNHVNRIRRTHRINRTLACGPTDNRPMVGATTRRQVVSENGSCRRFVISATIVADHRNGCGTHWAARTSAVAATCRSNFVHYRLVGPIGASLRRLSDRDEFCRRPI